jgi:DNA helicase-2/ATP-dependent DNA helicase PcrA
MEFIADLHIHSYLSRATAKNLNLAYLNLWAQLKGITVVGTGDFTHPQWFSELSERLQPEEEGLFALRPAYAAETAQMVSPSCQGPVRFILSAEISSIYKKDGKTRKVHNLILAPTLEVARKINEKLGRIGNIASDGRPILGLDAKALLEIVVETSEHAVLIPAHIWTPWFSVLGSKSGFDSVEECFEDLTPQIFAVETGLSADPAMHWRVSSLDRFTLVSNSDAHSPSNLGREANLFDTDLSYAAITEALRAGDPKRFLGTLEYFAEEGKYHFDGHRKCGARLSPLETLQNQGLCPVCGRPVTIGVMHRVEELADRKAGVRPKRAHPYTSLLPLTDVLSEIFQVGAKSQKVARAYRALLERVGPEFEILRKTRLDALEKLGPPLLGEAIQRMRNNQVQIAPGYDGEFGTVSLFTEEDRQHLLGQQALFATPSKSRAETKSCNPQLRLFEQVNLGVSKKISPRLDDKRAMVVGESSSDHLPCRERLLDNLNKSQQEAVRHWGGPLLIVAGPGTGKTRTLTHRIAYLLSQGTARPEQVLAVTFTNKAAHEMAERLSNLVDDSRALGKITIRTFHALCLDIISREADALSIKGPVSILNESDRRDLVKMAIQRAGGNLSALKGGPDTILHLVSLAKECMLSPEDDLTRAVSESWSSQFSTIYKIYQQLLAKHQLLDFDDLIFKTVKLFEAHEDLRQKYQQAFPFISVDEYQDINDAQYRLIRQLAPPACDICVIGDPKQAIYGFRGADVRYFQGFCRDYPQAKTIHLNQNYRSTETILRASGQVMGADSGNKQEGIWSGIYGVNTLTIAQLPTEKAEAEYIIKTIEEEVGGISHFSMDSRRIDGARGARERGFSDFAVLYRVKEQARALREAFKRSGIPFQGVWDQKLEARKGIRELLSYLKAALSLGSDLDVERILNFPARGITQETVEVLQRWSEETGIPLESALHRARDIPGLTPRARKKVTAFLEDLSTFKERIKGQDVYEQIRLIEDQFKIADEMSDGTAYEENLGILLSFSRSFGDRSTEFLARVSLENEQDLYDPRAEGVALMTMHASKGLEFPVLFIAGCEDGLIPYRREKDEDEDLQEERRLFYVALTRAQEEVFLTHTKQRRWFGKKTEQHISPYLEAIEEDLKLYKKPFSGRSTFKKKSSQLSLFEL